MVGRAGGGSGLPIFRCDGRRGETSLLESPLQLRDEQNGLEIEKPEGLLRTPAPNILHRNTFTGEVIESMTNYETPTHRLRGPPSKLIFLSDRKNVPTELKNLQERTMKRRRDFLARIHELNSQTAKLMSQYAEERMNLDLTTCDTFERIVVHPLVKSIDRLSIKREVSTNRLLDIPTLERRIGSLDVQMTRHVHVVVNDAMVEKLESLDDDLHRNLKSEIRTENATFNKIEGGIVQRFESFAGLDTWNVQAEGATHRSAIALLQCRIDKTIPKRLERAEGTLSRIASLREQLRKERAIRQATDSAIYEEIVRRTSSMKRAMISMASDGDSLK